MMLPGPPRRFAALIPVNDNNRGNRDQAGCDETKWLELVAKPVQNKDVTKPHGYGGQNDDEEGSVH